MAPSTLATTLPPLWSGRGIVTRSIDAADNEVAATIRQSSTKGTLLSLDWNESGLDFCDVLPRSPSPWRLPAGSWKEMAGKPKRNLPALTNTSSSSRRIPEAKRKLEHKSQAAAELSQAKMTGTSGACMNLRGGRKEAMLDSIENDRELAQHRRDIIRETGWIQRQEMGERLRRRRHQQRQEQTRQVLPSEGTRATIIVADVAHDAGVVHAREAAGFDARHSRAEFPDEVSFDKHETPVDATPSYPAGVSSSASNAEAHSASAEFRQDEQNPTDGVQLLSRLTLKSNRQSRIERISNLHSSRLHQTKLSKLLALRQKEFESLPEAEKIALRRAFVDADVDNKSHLTSKQLKLALKGAGLHTKNDMEKSEIMHICNEVTVIEAADFYGFCFEAVPRVREKLREMRRDALRMHFSMYDLDDNGHLDTDECTHIFEHLCAWDLDAAGVRDMRKHFDVRLRALQDPHTQEIEFAGFEVLLGDVQEQVARVLREGELRVEEEEGLDEEEMKAHHDELVGLHEAFVRAQGETGGISRSQLRHLLIDRGLFPVDKGMQQKFDQIVEDGNCNSDAGNSNFSDFLRVTRFMREMIISGNHYDLQQMFNRLDKARRGRLSKSNVSTLIGLLGLAPRCREDQAEIQRLLNEVYSDGSGEVGFPEFERLVLRVKERMKAAQRHRVQKTVMELHMAAEDASHYRDLFHMVDTDGVGALVFDQLKRLLELIHQQVSPEALQAELVKLNPEGIAIDFERFLRLVAVLSRDGTPRSPNKKSTIAVKLPNLLTNLMGAL